MKHHYLWPILHLISCSPAKKEKCEPSIDIEQWLRNNYGDSLEEAFAAKTILEGLDREAPLMTKQEQLEVKEDIAYSLKLYDLHGR